MTINQRNQYLPVMKALLKVMETRRSSPKDINTLLELTRKLVKEIPDYQNSNKMVFGSDIFKNFGLLDYGEPIVYVDGIPYVLTNIGKCKEYLEGKVCEGVLSTATNVN